MWPLLLKFGPLLFNLIPHIPDVVNVVEKFHGPTQGNGAGKLSSAMTLVTGLVPELEDAFNASPAMRNLVSAAISVVYEEMKISGSLTGVVAPMAPAAQLVATGVVQLPALPAGTDNANAPGGA